MYENETLEALKDKCRKRGLPVSGLKAAVIGRLRGVDVVEDLSSRLANAAISDKAKIILPSAIEMIKGMKPYFSEGVRVPLAGNPIGKSKCVYLLFKHNTDGGKALYVGQGTLYRATQSKLLKECSTCFVFLTENSAGCEAILLRNYTFEINVHGAIPNQPNIKLNKLSGTLYID